MVAGLKAQREAEAQAKMADVMRELHAETERAAKNFAGGAPTHHFF